MAALTAPALPEPLLAADSLLHALLRGDSPDWPGAASICTAEAFIERAEYHGVKPLAHEALRATSIGNRWPDSIRIACRNAAVAQAVFELAHQIEIQRVLSALARKSIEVVLLKGTGLAYSIYKNPVLRPRGDTDLLVAPVDRQRAWETLSTLGYQRISGPAGTVVGHQIECRLDDARGLVHSIDLHWRISNAQSFAWLIPFEELHRDAVSIPTLGSHAHRLCNKHALLLSLLHRAGNNCFGKAGSGDRLIWLYDIHLLASTLEGVEVTRFLQLAEDKRVVAIVLDGLRQCSRALPSSRVNDMIADLAKSKVYDSGAALLHGGNLRREWIEWRAVPGLHNRLIYLYNRLFPTAEYLNDQRSDVCSRSLARLRIGRLLRKLVGLAKAAFSSR